MPKLSLVAHDMPSKSKLREWQRKADGSPTPPIMQPPRVQDYVSSKNPETREGWDKYDVAVEEWWKSLNLGIGSKVDFSQTGGGGTGGGSGVVPVPGEGGTPEPGTGGTVGEKGEKGEKGDPGPVEILRTHVWIAKRTDGKPGEGVEHNPFDGSTWQKLDTIFRTYGINTTFHLGPGVFETRGGAPSTPLAAEHWAPRNGWQIIGSGRASTTLRLVGVATEDQYAFVISNHSEATPLSNFDVMDLTLDANSGNHPGTPTVGCCALSGSYMSFSRIRCIGWGTTSTVWLEVFAFGAGSTAPSVGDSYNIKIDNVVVEDHGVISGPTDAVTLMAFGGSNNHRLWDPATITRSGSTATATTAAAHKLKVGEWFRVTGAAQSEYNGSFQVVSTPSANAVTYAVAGSPATPATGTITLQHPYDPTGNGQGFTHNLVVRNCYCDGSGVFGTGEGSGITLGGVYGAVIENNTFVNLTAGYYQDSWRGGSATFRGNLFRNVRLGLYWNFGNANEEFDTVIIEGNIIELRPITTGTAGSGIFAISVRTDRPLGFRNFIIRGNTIRHIDGEDSPALISYAMICGGMDFLSIVDNTVDISDPNPIRVYAVTNKVSQRGNRSTLGEIVLARSNTGVPYFDPDIESDKIHKMAVLA